MARNEGLELYRAKCSMRSCLFSMIDRRNTHWYIPASRVQFILLCLFWWRVTVHGVICDWFTSPYMQHLITVPITIYHSFSLLLQTFTNSFLHSLSGFIWTAFTDLGPD